MIVDIEKFKTESYKKNPKLEELLNTLNNALDLVNHHAIEIKEKHPIIFIVGAPRSGTTLLTQWLASLNMFCYPSNLISRFYKAPFVGALIQEMLVNPEYSYKNELTIDNTVSFSSDTGKTRGITEPHEFWYYWRQFFDFPEIPSNNDEFIKNADFIGFQKGIYEYQQIYKKPFFMKSLIMNWYIESFSKNIEKPIFLYIKRDPIANMGSLLKTRERYLGNKDLWFSFKPKEYDRIKNKNPLIQVAGQVYFTNHAIEENFEKISKHRQITIHYEKFCKNPLALYDEIKVLLNKNNYSSEAPYNGPDKFSIPNEKYQDQEKELLKAYSYFTKNNNA